MNILYLCAFAALIFISMRYVIKCGFIKDVFQFNYHHLFYGISKFYYHFDRLLIVYSFFE